MNPAEDRPAGALVTGISALISGATGFIGSHLAERLAAAGARVRALVFYHPQGSWGWLDSLPGETLATLEILRPRRAYLIHISHELNHEETERTLPPSIRLAHDGLILEI